MRLRDHLQTIYDQHGRLTPEMVVQVARPKDHPLHRYVFDRSPKEAAEAWYLYRARCLLQVRYAQDVDGETKRMRSFYALPAEDSKPVWEPTDEIARDPFKEQVWLRDMERRIRELSASFGDAQAFIAFAKRTLGVAEDDDRLAA